MSSGAQLQLGGCPAAWRCKCAPSARPEFPLFAFGAAGAETSFDFPELGQPALKYGLAVESGTTEALSTLQACTLQVCSLF